MNQDKVLGLCGLLLRWCTALRYHIAATFTLYESVLSSIKSFFELYTLYIYIRPTAEHFFASYLYLPSLPPILCS